LDMKNLDAQEPFPADCVQNPITQRCTPAMCARPRAGGASTLSLSAPTAKELTQQTTSSVKLTVLPSGTPTREWIWTTPSTLNVRQNQPAHPPSQSEQKPTSH
jgi:hypothetical protein